MRCIQRSKSCIQRPAEPLQKRQEAKRHSAASVERGQSAHIEIKAADRRNGQRARSLAHALEEALRNVISQKEAGTQASKLAFTKPEDNQELER